MTPTPPKKQAKTTKDATEAIEVTYKGEGARTLYAHGGTEYRFSPGETTLVPRALAEKLAAEDPSLYEVA